MPSERIRFRGGLTCICVVTSLPVVEAELKKRGLIKNSVDIFQLGYTRAVAASAGTHSRGGCVDVGQYSDAQLFVWRMFGWRTQHRTPAQGFSNHGHTWPGGCPHLSPAARYQESEWLHKRDGLRGRGPVTGPGWTAITWQAALKKYRPSPAIAKDDLDMATWIRYATGKPQPVPDRKWIYLRINDNGDASFGTGPCKIISGTISLRIAGLPPGRKLQVRVVEDDVDGKTTKRAFNQPVSEVVSTGGETSRMVPFALNPGRAAKGQRRIRACVETDVKGVRVLWNQVSYWKA